MELLLCNLKLVVIMYHIKKFTRERIYEYPTGKCTILPPIIKPKLPETSNCPVTDC